MQNWCAFLRGVNVGGNSLKMAEVSEVFKNAGMYEVRTVLATGNIIFKSDKNEAELKKILEKEMSEKFQYEAFLFVRSEIEVKNMFNHNPFLAEDHFHIYIFVADKNTSKILEAEFQQSKKTKGEEAKTVDGDFYWKVPKGSTLDSEFGKILGRKNLKDKITSRNINTFAKIISKF